MFENPVLQTLLALVITGLVPFVVQFLKGTSLSGDVVKLLAFTISTVAALIISLVSSAVNLPSWTGDPYGFLAELGKLASVVFVVSQVIYVAIIKGLGIGMSVSQKEIASLTQ